MRDEAASAGFYHSALWPGKHGDHRWPRIQIRTIAELLAGQGFEIPPRPVQFKQAERAATTPGMAAPALWDAPSDAGVPVPVPVPDVDVDEEGEDGDFDDDADADAADDVP
jgi:hypothetical protein